MAESNRPPNTQLLVSESYVKELEERVQEAEDRSAVWKECIEHTTDFLEILREHFDDFDKLLKKVNEVNERIEFVVDADENIKYRINEG